MLQTNNFYCLFGGGRYTTNVLVSDRSGSFQSQPWRAQVENISHLAVATASSAGKSGEPFLVSFNSHFLNVETLGQLHYRFILFAVFTICLKGIC